MAVIPDRDDWIAGEEPTAAKLNANIRDVGNFVIRDRPLARVSRGSGQTIASGGSTIIWTTVNNDNDNMVDLGSDDEIVTITTSGLYLVCGQISYTDQGTNTSHYRVIELQKNAGRFASSNTLGAIASGDFVCNATATIQLTAGDELSVKLVQQSGGGTLPVSSAYDNYLSALWISE